MVREVDLLIDAADRGYLVVEKDSNVLWTQEELLASQAAGRFPAEGRITAPNAGPTAVTSVFPGCLQQVGASEDYSRYVPVGQTAHFVLFAKTES